MNTTYRNALTILSARIKSNLFAMRQDQRNGGTLYIGSWEEHSSQNVSSILIPRAINQYFKEINTDPAYRMVFHPSADTYTTWHLYPGSRGTHCPKVLSTAEAHSTWSRRASSLDVETLLPPLGSHDYEAVQSFIERTICALSLETC